MPNRLAKETSPYLLQHKDNPVDWYPWGEEALARARAENKPILLSIGYSACHWCHVMEHESFENPEIAKLMNENFVNIKVDREERPDLDHIYQNVSQAITRSGGWPLTVFLTPDLKPYFGGTYFPPEDRWGRAGFPRVLAALSEAYRTDPEGVAENARRLTEFISAVESVREDGPAGPDETGLSSACEEILSSIDWERGGLSGAPKFPNAMLLTFLWRMGRAFGSERARDAAVISLEKMASGGIYDHLGGGWHRYSVDETWSVPHFEKMLYDNALLMKLTAEILLSRVEIGASRRELLLRTLGETVEYVFREMTSPEGGFYSTQDADSEGEEGKYFVWDPEELVRVLEPDEARVFAIRCGVDPAGNFEHGKTVLHLAVPIQGVASRAGISEAEALRLLDSASAKLKAVRDQRVPPGTDRKVLASWNGLMISALAWAARALDTQGEREIAASARAGAERAFDFVRTKLGRPEGRLWSTFQEGRARHNAYLDDYAFLAMAALDLARFTRDREACEERIRDAQLWTATIRRRFSDPMGPGYFFTSDDHESLIHRPKTAFDQAIPSGTAVALEAMLALAEIDLDGAGVDFGSEAERQISRLFPVAKRTPLGMGELLNASLLAVEGPVVYSGPDASASCTHPHFFQKPAAPGTESRNLRCHRQTCQEI